ncbi:MAG: endonuclease/exonuclease/phosphatase family protein [Gammaproteobacteria bacterium]|nr:endonuclease/exonuclease/phosphatase family protein [Gammaproteobacteria bacterium]
MKITRLLFLLVSVLLLSISGAAIADHEENEANARKIDVMTANLYLGADIFRIVEAAADSDNPYAIPTAVTEVFGIVQATNFPERAEAIANSIMRRRPDVIGLQEVSWYRTGPYDGIPVNAEDTAYDFLQLLMDALAARGLDYKVAGVATNADVEAPMFVSAEYDLADLRLTDRDVILVRGDVDAGPAFAGNYSFNAGFDLGGTTVYFTRGYVMVPVTVRGRSYLFVNTHLETRLNGSNPFGIVYQFAQALELAGTVDAANAAYFGDLPVILVGDLNSDPNDMPVDVPDGLGIPFPVLYPPYQVFAGAGYTDTWLQRQGRRDSGETCCHDELLDNRKEHFYERIDHVLFRDSNESVVLGPVQSEVINDTWKDKTASGLWESDHGFVSASLKQKYIKHGKSGDSDESDDSKHSRH